VDRDVERGESFGDDPLEVELGEPGEGREVAVEEREPVVVVFTYRLRRIPFGSW
jgi:hypothetical protein